MCSTITSTWTSLQYLRDKHTQSCSVDKCWGHRGCWVAWSISCPSLRCFGLLHVGVEPAHKGYPMHWEDLPSSESNRLLSVFWMSLTQPFHPYSSSYVLPGAPNQPYCSQCNQPWSWIPWNLSLGHILFHEWTHLLTLTGSAFYQIWLIKVVNWLHWL